MLFEERQEPREFNNTIGVWRVGVERMKGELELG